MGFDGLDAQAQAVGDLPGGFPANDQSQDFQLARGQVVRVGRLRLVFLVSGERLVDDRVGDGRAQVAFVVTQGLECMLEFGGGCVLEQVAVCAGFQCLHDDGRVGVHGQDQHLALRPDAFELLQCFQASGLPHGNVQQDNIR
ncbi:hypothetical protein D3C85_1250360 [compost metagenome]